MRILTAAEGGDKSVSPTDMIMVCRKMYHGDLFPENFDQPGNDGGWYPEKDYHAMDIGEIAKVFVKE